MQCVCTYIKEPDPDKGGEEVNLGESMMILDYNVDNRRTCCCTTDNVVGCIGVTPDRVVSHTGEKHMVSCAVKKGAFLGGQRPWDKKWETAEGRPEFQKAITQPTYCSYEAVHKAMVKGWLKNNKKPKLRLKWSEFGSLVVDRRGPRGDEYYVALIKEQHPSKSMPVIYLMARIRRNVDCFFAEFIYFNPTIARLTRTLYDPTKHGAIVVNFKSQDSIVMMNGGYEFDDKEWAAQHDGEDKKLMKTVGLRQLSASRLIVCV